jgi:hypothetical protein
MRKRLTALLLGSGAAALALSLATTTAMASSASTWSVKPGGSIKASGPAQVKDTKTGTVAKCSSVKLGGTLKKGSGLSGTGLGSVTSASFSGCKIATIAVTVKVHGLPWKLDATSYKNGTTSGTVSGIDLVATATGCKATLDGTGAGKDNGMTKITYSNSSGKLSLLGPGGNLHSWAVSGCFGLVKNGDPEQASGTETVTPKQTIKSS